MSEADLAERAAELIPEITAGKSAKLSEFNEQHKMDVQSFKFECRRHGDFLAIFVTRGFASPPGFKLVVAINLMTVSTISISRGAVPDLAGTVSFERTWSAAGDGVRAVYNGREYPRLPVIVSPQQETMHHQMLMMHAGHRDPLAGLYVREAPRRAADDHIHFGPSCALGVPTGLGDDVFASAMIEFGRASLTQDQRDKS